MPPEMSSRFLEATVNGLQENQPSCIRISAVKAIYWFCKASVGGTNNTLGNIIRSHLPNIFQGLFTIASQTSTEIFTLVMETFQVLVSVMFELSSFFAFIYLRCIRFCLFSQLDKAFTASVENKICPLTIAAFLKFYSDHEIFFMCQDIFKTLTQNPDCIGPLQTRLIPTLTSMMAVSPMDKLKDGKSY